MSQTQKRDIDKTKIPVNRKLLREWVETFCPDCQHGMNVIECSCWDWCGLAPTCPQINKEGQRYALKLIGEKKWGKT
jgi:hypothetical protein